MSLSAAFRGRAVLLSGLLLALGLIILSGWSVETTWVQPSIKPPPEGSAGRTQWGGTIPELKNPPRIFMDNDPYYYIAYAQEMVERGAWRIRSTDLDNVPFGREMHWDNGSMWLLVFCGKLVSLWTGEPMGKAIETGSLFSNPLLFFVSLVLAGIFLARRFGAWAAAAFVVLLPSLPALTWDYGYARPGHHGLHTTASMGLLVSLLLAGGGWVRRRALMDQPFLLRNWPAEDEARRWFLISGCFGGMALWIGATQQLFIIFAAGAGLVLSFLLVRREELEARDFGFEPELLRLWGRAACVASLFFYALEYLPNHIAMRLEVNHPIYSLAWLAAGELLCLCAVWRKQGKWPQGRERHLAWLLFFITIFPVVCLGLGPKGWHALHDPYMKRQHEFINMFEPFSRSLANVGPQVILLRFGLLPLGYLAALGLLIFGRLPVVWKATLRLVLPAAVITGAMLWVQVRWSGLLCLSLGLLAFVVGLSLWLLSREWRPWPRWISRGGVVALFLLPNLVFFGISLRDSWLRGQSGVLDPYLAWTIASRDVAFNLKRIAAYEPVRVMSGPGITPALHFFGKVRGTSALYWENIDGVRDGASFFSDQGEERARALARERKITHVVIEQSPQQAIESCVIYYGKRDDTQIENCLGYRLANPLGKIPDWLEPIPYYGSPMAASYQMRIYRVLPDKL